MFCFTPRQEKQIANFKKKQNLIHKKLEKKGIIDLDGIGPPYTYHITPTGIGDVVIIEDRVTLTELDVTDYDSW